MNEETLLDQVLGEFDHLVKGAHLAFRVFVHIDGENPKLYLSSGMPEEAWANLQSLYKFYGKQTYTFDSESVAMCRRAIRLLTLLYVGMPKKMDFPKSATLLTSTLWAEVTQYINIHK